ncbi:MAG: histidine kinase [Actinobacteria bacterium]|jgi:two-component sensor histidine kinase|uniref:histidine kinase n=1 Tax=freshwater metagenome TaxID=449393 RepID=A0A6J6F292_9ZZZZ|nr:histidine kinase [Actinomycetota bacterium]
MPHLEEHLRDRSPLDQNQMRRIRELTSDWQLLADLSFADLILWVPIRKDFKSWPTGYVAVAHIRPTTAATVFPQDVIGDEISWGSRPRIDQALSGAEIIRDAQPEKFGELLIKEETIPVILNEQVIAVISRHRNADLMRQPSRLELNYREVAHNVYRMVAEGTFPYIEHNEFFDPAVRVGDGLIRLDINGAIIYASPNAKSAFNRIGWAGELEGNNLGEVARKLSLVKREAHEEAIEVSLSGKSLRRVEIENTGGTIDLMALPLLAAGDRIGAIVLLQNVTELRRRERELVTKDATIREIHHRVKNNLQTVSALLRLQSRRIEDPAASAALNEAVRRIASIALVHETLSSSSEASVAFDDVLDRLVAHALELSPRMGQLQIARDGALGSLDPRIATPLSLVVTELIHNALEHGLATSGEQLKIEVNRIGDVATITIFDDGVGLPTGFSLSESANLGLQIVRTLTENELKGSINLVRTDRGTEAQLKFPL